MFEIDKAKFGAFVAQLRKEKGLMQKELAEKLYVSDKAVSQRNKNGHIGDAEASLPLADCLIRNIQLFSQFLLHQALFFTKLRHEGTEFCFVNFKHHYRLLALF